MFKFESSLVESLSLQREKWIKKKQINVCCYNRSDVQ